jgi:predicted amidophosphoribosyltransferase
LAHVCDTCWNASPGLCLNCAPDAQVEVESSRARGETDMAGQMAYTAGQDLASHLDVKSPTQLVCPKCGAETKGSKFCPECGEKLAVSLTCSGCGTQLAPGTKFCPECGAKQA